jgi:hypothetical protein
MRFFGGWDQNRQDRCGFAACVPGFILKKCPSRRDSQGTNNRDDDIMDCGSPNCVTCVICQTRKEKRFCPAVHGRICPQCCGEQREVTLDCPSDCTYLLQARQRELPRPLEGLDPAGLFPQVQISRQFLTEHEPLIAGLSHSLAQSSRADRELYDRDLIEALTAVTRSYETLVNSGLHYEPQLSSLPQQNVAATLQKMLEEYRKLEQQHLGSTRLRDSDVLRATAFLVRIAHGHTTGRPKSRAFRDFLVQNFQGKKPPAEEASRLIVP